MTVPFLHILIPAYGPSPYLAETLASALAAADGRTAITVVDDGSPGDEVARTVQSVGPRVEYVRLPENRGVSGAFAACAELNRGEYATLLGSDDLLGTTYVAAVRALVDGFSRPAMAHPGVVVVDADGRPCLPVVDRVKRLLAPHGRSPRRLSGERLAASLLTGNWLYFPAIAWRADVLRGEPFRPDMTTALDLDLALRVVLRGGALAWGGGEHFRYRRHVGSVSSREAVDGWRFDEERAVHRWAAGEARARGWPLAAAAARLRLTSRLHALLARRAG